MKTERAEELALIEEHIQNKGVYKARMGESLYGDEAPLIVWHKTRKKANYRKQKPPPPPKYSERDCEECGKSFVITRKQQREGVRFCSTDCQFAERRRQAKAKRESRMFPCTACGKVHFRHPHRAADPGRMFCSRKCFLDYGFKFPRREIEINGVKYESVTEAAKQLGITTKTARKWEKKWAHRKTR